jgi:hypothetical protein
VLNKWRRGAPRRLQLNSDKTEIIWFGSRANLRKIADQDLTLSIIHDTIHPKELVRDLGVWLDSELTLKQHVSKVAGVCFYQLRRLRQIRRLVGHDVAVRLVLAMIMSRLDYCNATFAGLPQCAVSRLQRVQNAAARLVFQLGPHEPVSPALIQLHWLPVRSRITYKLCLLMYRIRAGNCPSYLSSIVEPAFARSTRSGLRSADSSKYTLPHLRTKLGERAFSYAGPAA